MHVEWVKLCLLMFVSSATVQKAIVTADRFCRHRNVVRKNQEVIESHENALQDARQVVPEHIKSSVDGEGGGSAW